MKKLLTAFLFIYNGSIPALVFSQSTNPILITSPDKAIIVTVRNKVTTRTDTELTYSVTAFGRSLVEPSRLGLSTRKSDDHSWTIENVKQSVISETYSLVLGKSKTALNHCHQTVIALKNRSGQHMQVVFRAYNDGVAFRYVWPKAEAALVEVLDEWTQFNIASNPKVMTLCFPNYTSSHETNYTVAALNQIPVDTLMDLPTLFLVADNLLVAVTEANLNDYPGMYLSPTKAGHLVTKLSPLPNRNGLKAKLKTPHPSPWRVLMIGQKPATLIESNIILNLSEPNVIKDVSWIKTNKSTWHWWDDTIIPADAPFMRGMNYESMKYYIDFASKYGISCHSLTDVDGDSWYTSPLKTYPLPGPGTDVTKPNPKLRMDQLLAYAKSKNVRIRLWVHWKALEPQLEEAFMQYEKWGIEGLMVDYMDRDDQEMVNFYHRVMESAARHKLTIEFHGAYKPTGLRRTYPNLITTEAVLNLEFLKWSDRCTPQHNVNVAFTRMLAGPLDYHLGGFNSVTPAKFTARKHHPMVMGTRAHILGMYVVYETYLQLLCDAPEAYIDQPGFDFLLNVPATWDETKVLKASVGEYIVIARRSGTNWYIGGLNNNTVRDVEIPLDFLKKGSYTLDQYTDTADATEEPNHVTFGKRRVSSADVLRVKLAAGGGLAMRVEPAQK